MIHVFDGNPGHGKTYMLAVTTLNLLRRNKKWYKSGKTKVIRKLATNMVLSEAIHDEFGEYITFWSDLRQLVDMRESDVIFDDMSTYLDSQRYLDTPIRVKRWLRFHEHYGVNIYGNAQDFLSIDITVRRLITSVQNVRKLIGSRRPSATRPPVKRIWGLILLREVQEKDLDKERTKRQTGGIPQMQALRKRYCGVFDTMQDFEQGDWPPLEHIERFCSEAGCDMNSRPKISHR